MTSGPAPSLPAARNRCLPRIGTMRRLRLPMSRPGVRLAAAHPRSRCHPAPDPGGGGGCGLCWHGPGAAECPMVLRWWPVHRRRRNLPRPSGGLRAHRVHRARTGSQIEMSAATFARVNDRHRIGSALRPNVAGSPASSRSVIGHRVTCAPDPPPYSEPLDTKNKEDSICTGEGLWMYLRSCAHNGLICVRLRMPSTAISYGRGPDVTASHAAGAPFVVCRSGETD
jgi:hypothetical protein